MSNGAAIATALDAPDDVLDEQERRFVAAIRKHGWFCTNVFGDDEGPGFSYTTGFWLELGLPEIVVFGLKSEVAHDLLWNIYRRLKAGEPLSTTGPVDDILENVPVQFRFVAATHYPDYLGWSRWFYGTGDFLCLQLIWPDRAGVFPWQPGADPRFAGAQPDLSADGWR